MKQEIMGGSGISWTIYKSFALYSRHLLRSLSLIICVMLSDVKHLYLYLYLQTDNLTSTPSLAIVKYICLGSRLIVLILKNLMLMVLHKTHCDVLFALTIMCEIFIFQGLFPPGQGSTIGVDFMIKTIDVNKEPVKVYQ